MSQLIPHDPEDDEKDWASDPKRMGFLDHLEEFRWTIIKPLVVFVVGFIGAMVGITKIKDILFWPLFQNLSEEQRRTFEGLSTMNFGGVYSAMLQIGLIVGVAVASPFFIYYLAKFVAPALTKRERRMLVPGAIGVLIFFFAGCLFGFFFLLPRAIQATIYFNQLLGSQIIWTTGNYFGFITWAVLGMGLSFELPLVILVLVFMGVVSVEKLRKWRRHMVLVLAVLAALLTPPDPVTQMSLVIPMYVLYEISIWVAAMFERKREEDQREAAREQAMDDEQQRRLES